MHFDWRSFIDWVSVLSAIGTVVAAGLAAWAIKQASKQAKANAILIAEERWLGVQLDALQRLADVVGSAHYDAAMERQRISRASVQLAIIDAELPTCRARFSSRDHAAIVRALGLPAGVGWGQIDEYPTVTGVVEDRMAREVAEAVRALVANRSSQIQTSPQVGHSR